MAQAEGARALLHADRCAVLERRLYRRRAINGPRGQYWTGDRELSPLQNYLVGGRLVASWNGHKGDRIAGMLLGLSTEASADLIKTHLDEFTWAGRKPNDTFAVVGGLAVSGQF